MTNKWEEYPCSLLFGFIKKMGKEKSLRDPYWSFLYTNFKKTSSYFSILPCIYLSRLSARFTWFFSFYQGWKRHCINQSFSFNFSIQSNKKKEESTCLSFQRLLIFSSFYFLTIFLFSSHFLFSFNNKI